MHIDVMMSQSEITRGQSVNRVFQLISMILVIYSTPFKIAMAHIQYHLCCSTPSVSGTPHLE